MNNFNQSKQGVGFYEIPVDSIDSLNAILIKNKIDTSQWRHELSCKTVKNLFTEISRKESKLIFEDGKLWRKLEVLRVLVQANIDGQLFILHEYQKYDASDNIVRRKMKASLGEKLTANEDKLVALHRAVKEELGLALKNKNIIYLGDESTTYNSVSSSFPNMPTKFSFYEAQIELFGSQIKSEYIEYQPQKNKTNIFKWELSQ